MYLMKKIQMFSFGMCQEEIRHETTEGSIEFIWYWILQWEQTGAQSYSQGINQQKCVGLSRYSDWLSKYSHLKFE